MGFGAPGSYQPLQAAAKYKVFVSYHHGGDQLYYNEFSRMFHDVYEFIYDNSLEREIDSDNIDYVLRRIRENYVTGSSCTIVLVGKNTYGRKYIDWEIKATLDAGHGLIGVCLPGAPRNATNGLITVPDRLHENIKSGYALWRSWENLVNNASQLRHLVADAKSRDKKLIVNGRERMSRNLGLT